VKRTRFNRKEMDSGLAAGIQGFPDPLPRFSIHDGFPYRFPGYIKSELFLKRYKNFPN